MTLLNRRVFQEALERIQTQAAIKNAVPANQLVLIAIALNHGLLMHHLMDPRHYPDHLVTTSSELVFDKLMGFNPDRRRSDRNPKNGPRRGWKRTSACYRQLKITSGLP